jgi:hypothetical protein
MTSPVVTQSCTGTNRLGRPCTNRVSTPQGWCGKCQAPAPRPTVAGNEPPAPSPPAVIPPGLITCFSLDPAGTHRGRAIVDATRWR